MIAIFTTKNYKALETKIYTIKCPEINKIKRLLEQLGKLHFLILNDIVLYVSQTNNDELIIHSKD